MKRVLVLGAGGFIGKSLCLKLSENHLVRAFDLREVMEFKGNSNIDMVVGDFINMQDYTGIINGVDTIYHLISTTLPSDETHNIPSEIEQNIIPSVKLLESMVHNGVKDIIFASSAGTIYGETGDHINNVTDSLNPICSYGAQKKVIETYLQFYGTRYGINYKIARLSNPYGRGQDQDKPQGVIPIFINRLLKGDEIKIFGDGTSERDYIFLNDLVDGIIKVDEYIGEEHIFNLGYGQVYSLLEIIRSIEGISGKTFKNIQYAPKRYHDVSKTLIEVKSSQELLQWKPKVGMEQGIKDILNWLKDSLKA